MVAIILRSLFFLDNLFCIDKRVDFFETSELFSSLFILGFLGCSCFLLSFKLILNELSKSDKFVQSLNICVT